jgi:hypothetical protein
VPVPTASAPDLDTRIALIQALIPVALERVKDELTADVKQLAGERYVREHRLPGHVRWTPQLGSIYLADQKIPIAVPRVRDRLRNQEVPLPTYQRLQQPRALDTGLLHKVLGGLSTFRRKLQAAYDQPTHDAAKRALGEVRAELLLLNASAAASLDEGLEETLTLCPAKIAIVPPARC